MNSVREALETQVAMSINDANFIELDHIAPKVEAALRAEKRAGFLLCLQRFSAESFEEIEEYATTKTAHEPLTAGVKELAE